MFLMRIQFLAKIFFYFYYGCINTSRFKITGIQSTQLHPNILYIYVKKGFRHSTSADREFPSTSGSHTPGAENIKELDQLVWAGSWGATSSPWHYYYDSSKKLLGTRASLLVTRTRMEHEWNLVCWIRSETRCCM